MKATFIKNLNDRQRVYKLSERIKKGKSDWVGEIDLTTSDCNFYPDIKSIFDSEKVNGFEYIVVSDAHDHIERLVFPAIKVPDELVEKYCKNHDNKLDFAMTMEDIAGKHTRLIDGGDPNSIYSDEVYLRFLTRLNNLTWEGVENKNV